VLDRRGGAACGTYPLDKRDADSQVWAHVLRGLLAVRMLEQIGGGSAGGEDLVEGGECD
jgi:hypothetical protein